VREITRLGARVEKLTAQVTKLASAADANPDELAALLAELERAEAAHRRALTSVVERKVSEDSQPEIRRHTAPFSRGETPARERVLAALELLGVPARGRLVSDAAFARTGLDIEPRQLASLRRSELASWRSGPDRRPVYVVPALHSRRFEPLRGLVASSAWEPRRRIVGPMSPRVDHLRATARVAENVAWAREHSPDLAVRYEQLLWRLARSVPSADGDDGFDPARVEVAAKAELALLEEEDRAEREAAAQRLSKLPAEQQLFGAGLQVVREENA
jgi:hypothetical protein